MLRKKQYQIQPKVKLCFQNACDVNFHQNMSKSLKSLFSKQDLGELNLNQIMNGQLDFKHK